MTDIHDVIIVGAGVSGLMLAKLLGGSALRVLLLEKKSEIRVEPNTFGTFTRGESNYRRLPARVHPRPGISPHGMKGCFT